MKKIILLIASFMLCTGTTLFANPNSCAGATYFETQHHPIITNNFQTNFNVTPPEFNFYVAALRNITTTNIGGIFQGYKTKLPAKTGTITYTIVSSYSIIEKNLFDDKIVNSNYYEFPSQHTLNLFPIFTSEEYDWTSEIFAAFNPPPWQSFSTSTDKASVIWKTSWVYCSLAVYKILGPLVSVKSDLKLIYKFKFNVDNDYTPYTNSLSATYQ